MTIQNDIFRVAFAVNVQHFTPTSCVPAWERGSLDCACTPYKGLTLSLIKDKETAGRAFTHSLGYAAGIC